MQAKLTTLSFYDNDTEVRAMLKTAYLALQYEKKKVDNHAKVPAFQG